mgnify:CR=1 FL=1
MKEPKIVNAKITRTMLGREDHGIFTFMIFVEFNGSTCGIGGYSLDQAADMQGGRKYSVKGLEAIGRILDVIGVDKWEDLTGKYIRIVDDGWGSPVNEIGHIMQDKWFNLKNFFSGENER